MSELVLELEVCCAQMAEIYCKSVAFSKDLDPQESMQGEELLSLICNLLVQVCYDFRICLTMAKQG